MSFSEVLDNLKRIESHASTLVGVADPQEKHVITSAVLTPAREMVKMAREAIDNAKAEFEEFEERVSEAEGRATDAEGKIADANTAREAAENEAAQSKAALTAIADAGSKPKAAGA